MVNVSLSNMSEFLEFKGFTLENIVSKSGRCLFPSPTFTITGLNPNHHYQISIGLQQSRHSMNYVSNEWKKGSTIAAQEYTEQDVQHESGVRTGEVWMGEMIEFQHLRLTNCIENSTASTVCINSRHKYIPVLKVFRVELSSRGWEKLETEPLKFSFEETSFVAVTKYVNKEVSALKTTLNKFAHEPKTSEKRPLQATQRKRKCDENEPVEEPKRQKQMEPTVQHHDSFQLFNVPQQPMHPFGTPSQHYFYPHPNIYPVPQPYFNPLPISFAPAQVMTQFPYPPATLNYPSSQFIGYPPMLQSQFPQPQFAQPTFYQQYPPYF